MNLWALELVDGKVRTADPTDVRLSPPKADFAWLNVEATQNDVLPDEVREIYRLCPVTLHDILYGYVNPGIEQDRGCLAFTLSCPTREHPSRFVPLGIFLSDRRLATISPEPCPVIDEVRKAWMDDPQDVGMDAPSVLWTLLDAIIDDFYPALDDLHDRADELEQNLFQSNKMDPAGPLALKRELLVLRKRVSPVRDNLNSLIRVGAPLIPASMNMKFGDLQGHCLRLIENADLGRDIVAAIMEAQLSIASNRLNEVMRALTVISTLLMVCSLVAGIYGMNFRVMPELQWTYGYPFAMIIMGGLCLLVLWLFKRKGWM